MHVKPCTPSVLCTRCRQAAAHRPPLYTVSHLHQLSVVQQLPSNRLPHELSQWHEHPVIVGVEVRHQVLLLRLIKRPLGLVQVLVPVVDFAVVAALL
jgi:hypothetical protein